MLRVIAGVGPVDGLGREPEAGRDHFGGDAFAVEALLQFSRFLADLRFRFVVDLWHSVVVVEHHCVEAELLELREFPVETCRRSHGRTVRVLAFADVPGTETKPVRLRLGHKRARRLGVLAGIGNGKIYQKI